MGGAKASNARGVRGARHARGAARAALWGPGCGKGRKPPRGARGGCGACGARRARRYETRKKGGGQVPHVACAGRGPCGARRAWRCGVGMVEAVVAGRPATCPPHPGFCRHPPTHPPRSAGQRPPSKILEPNVVLRAGSPVFKFFKKGLPGTRKWAFRLELLRKRAGSVAGSVRFRLMSRAFSSKLPPVPLRFRPVPPVKTQVW